MTVRLLEGDVRAKLAELAPDSVHCIVTSVPYWALRAYGTEPQVWPSGWRGEHGQEPTPQLYVAHEVEIWRALRRVLRPDGIAWLNIGDTYAANRPYQVTDNKHKDVGNGGAMSVPPGLKPKDLALIPERLALALQDDGWWIRARLPWVKRSSMPESAKDRPGAGVEYWFMLTKRARYFFDMAAVRQISIPRASNIGRPRRVGHNKHAERNQHSEGGFVDSVGDRNFRDGDLFFASLAPPHGLISDAEGSPLALDVNTAGYAAAHFATFPTKLISPLIKASTSERGCCAGCGAPWVRVVESDDERHWTERRRTNDASKRWAEGSGGSHGGSQFEPAKKGGQTWRPSCACPAPEPVPCTVLDPFGGAGTTGLVADRLGRDAILIELQTKYAAMARDRITDDAPLFAEVAR